MNRLTYRVVVEFIVAASDPQTVTEKLEALDKIGRVATIKASATKTKKGE